MPMEGKLVQVGLLLHSFPCSLPLRVVKRNFRLCNESVELLKCRQSIPSSVGIIVDYAFHVVFVSRNRTVGARGNGAVVAFSILLIKARETCSVDLCYRFQPLPDNQVEFPDPIC